MIATTLPLAPGLLATLPASDSAPLLEQVAALRRENAALCAENAALRVENAALQARIRELEARLGQNSSNSSRPPSTDPLQAPPRPKAPPTGRKRGGQPGHRGAFRARLPVEQVDEVVPVVLGSCRHCGQPFPEASGRRRSQIWRHQGGGTPAAGRAGNRAPGRGAQTGGDGERGPEMLRATGRVDRGR